MIAIAYWNLGKRALVHHVVDLINDVTSSPTLSGSHGEIILGLTETRTVTISALTAALGPAFTVSASPYKKFICIFRLKTGRLTSEFEEEHAWPLALQRGRGKALQAYHLWFVHRSSPFGKFNPGAYSVLDAAKLRERVELREVEHVTDNSLLIGDFNNDPYSEAMVAGQALNAVMCRDIAERMRYRTVGRGRFRKKIPLFYNAMWGGLGDQTDTEQPGSFYNGGDVSDSAIWHALDQVLVRPSVIPHLKKGTPKFITKIGSTRLLLPSTNAVDISVSDHLPVLVSLKI